MSFQRRMLVWQAVLMGLVFQGVAQPASLRFEHLHLEDGLTNYVVMALAQDATGFLWIGTQRGLSRYDGARMTTFQKASGVPGALHDDYIFALAEDPRQPGALWIGTNAGGVSYYDPATQHFTTFRADSSGSGLGSDDVRALYVDRSGTVWAGTGGAGMYRYNHEAARFDRVVQSDGQPVALASDSVRVIYEPARTPGTLWIGTTNGLVLYDLATQQLRTFHNEPANPNSLSHNTVLSIAEAGGAVWCGTADGVLHRYDPLAERFERLDALLDRTPLGPISALAPASWSREWLWVGTRGQGLLAFNTRTQEIHQFSHLSDNPIGLSDNEVLALLEDEQDLLWVGTFGGLNKALLGEKRFVPRRGPSDLFASDEGLAVMNIYESPSEPGVVWFGTIRGGLWRYDRQANSYTSYFVEQEHPLSLVFAMHEDQQGGFWLGSEGAILYEMDRSSEAVASYPLPFGTDVYIKQIYEAPSQPGVLWIATRGLGLLAFDVQARRLLHQYTTKTSGGGALTSDNIWAVHEDPQEPGVLWIGTHDGGLNRLNTHSGEVSIWRHNESEACPPSDRVTALATTEEGGLWLGTYGSGFAHFDLRTGACTLYAEEDGLVDTEVGALSVDQKGKLWVLTSSGLSRFDPVQNIFTTFTEADGLQDGVFYWHAHHQNAQGEIFVGGPGGFNIFHPDSILIDTTPPNVVLTQVLVDGESVTLEREGADFKPLRLTYQQNDLAFEFAALDLRLPAKNRYKYKLHDNEDWQPLGNETAVRFPQLAHGSYTFLVTGTNRDGYWNEEGVVLRFRIAPPFWRAWWFWSLIATLGVALIVAAYQYRIAQLQRVERTRQRIADDLHDDIGSKISNVALRLDLVGRQPSLSDEDRLQLTDLSQTARGVVDDLRDAIWIVDAGHDRLADLFTRMEQVADDMLRGQRSTWKGPEVVPDVALSMEQRRHLYLFFKEALHNAVRHAQAEHIDIRLGYDVGTLRLQVRDDGTGFDKAHSQAGRGLKTLQARAEQLGGQLRIESAPGQGTTVHLTADIP